MSDLTSRVPGWCAGLVGGGCSSQTKCYFHPSTQLDRSSTRSGGWTKRYHHHHHHHHHDPVLDIIITTSPYWVHSCGGGGGGGGGGGSGGGGGVGVGDGGGDGGGGAGWDDLWFYECSCFWTIIAHRTLVVYLLSFYHHGMRTTK